MADSGAWRYRSVARTDVGLVRARNEDALVDRPDDGLWAVVDGMGGHVGGARASGLIRDALAQLATPLDADACLAAVRARIEDVHAQLYADTAAGRGGSTVVVLLAAGGRFTCLWAGDSRLQRWRAGRLERLSRDHSLLEELVPSGTVPAEQAHRHPLANRITRAVGIGPAAGARPGPGQFRRRATATCCRATACTACVTEARDRRAAGRCRTWTSPPTG